MRKLTLNITKANISNGRQANPGKCPIANSLRENIANITHVSVLPNEASIRVKKGKKILAYKSKLTSKAYNFIRKFDDGKRVKPFSLTLDFVQQKNLVDLV